MTALANKYKDQGVVWLAINSGGPGKQGHGVEVNKAGAEKWGIDYPILTDESGTVGRTYKAKTTPHLYVVDAKGNVLLKKGSSLSQVWIERLIKRGISTIDIATDEGEAAPAAAQDPSQSAQVAAFAHGNLQEHMKLIFTPNLNQPHMKALAKSTYQFFKNRA